MTLREAIDVRCSRRKYLKEPISEDKLAILKALVDQLNSDGKLKMQLVINNSGAFSNLAKTYGFFTGVENYLALVGEDDENVGERLGYYGERFVLEATRLGLGTCWVGATFDKKSCPCEVLEKDAFYGVIALGNVPQDKSSREKVILLAVHAKKSKTAEQMSNTVGDAPEWFERGMKAVERAPSARNRQPITFFCNNGIVTAKSKNNFGYEKVDLGIAKLHFEIGAGNGHWQWGDGEYVPEPKKQ